MIDLDNLSSAEVRRQLNPLPHSRPYTTFGHISGTGILTMKIARRFPRSRVVGVDLHEEYIAIAKQKAKDLGLNNVEFIAGRAEDIVLAEGADCITSSYLAKYADLELLVSHAKKMLRDNGILIMHELT